MTADLGHWGLMIFSTGTIANHHLLCFFLLYQALESFILRCPRDVAPHTILILDLSLEYLSYDPNFTDDMDEDQDEDMDGEEDEDEYGHCLSGLLFRAFMPEQEHVRER